MNAKTKVQSRAMPAIAGVKIKYTNEPLGKIKVIQDFLPSPSELAFREEGIKVTLALSKKSVEFFKYEAEKHQTQYQRMIRRLIDAYVDAQAAANPTRTPQRARPKKTSRLG
jgi:predicted DNA binding CopG/RHH family protein